MGCMAELVVVTGPPGAGKSTIARLLVKGFNPSALVAGDDVFAFIDQGYVAPWTAEAADQNRTVVAAAAAAAGRLVIGGYTVVYDGVIGPWLLQAFGAATGLGQLHYVLLLPPERVCVERVRSRVGHGFSDVDATRHMYDAFAAASVLDRHVVRLVDPAEVLASSIRDLLLKGTFTRAVDDAS